jgi:Acetyltransferase (isoleucine patch superfamily)
MKQHVTLPSAAADDLRAFVDTVDERLRGDEPTAAVVRDVLIDLHGDREAYDRFQAGEQVSAVTRARLESYDPRNATIESGYYAEVKQQPAFDQSKQLQWLWRQFDTTPVADNVAFALAFRQMLGKHLFAECGDNCRFFKNISMTYGHNITIGDNVVIHDDVHLDDRGRVTIGDRVSIADNVHVYSHDHDIVDQTEVHNYHTVIEDDARVTYDSLVRAGARVGENAVIAAKSMAQRDTPAHHIAAGTPAESIGVKPGWESAASPVTEANVDRRDERRIEYDDPNVEQFDEFGRDRTPPDA